MRFVSGVTSALALVSGLVMAAPNLAPRAPTTEEIQSAKSVEDFRDLAMQALESQQADLQRRSEQGSCTLENARVRRDWEHMSKCERKGYIKAVQCLWDLPAVDTEFSAAQNYFDEFVAIHANVTDFVHGTANFFTWHRYLIALWEDTLRDQCGYKGALPYWNWYKYQSALHLSPVFDGSDTSFGSTGEYFPHNGKGGGCIKDGPFVGYTINIGPIRPAMNGYEPWMKDQRDYNPRCQRRDLVHAASERYTVDGLYDLLAGDHSHTVELMQNEFQAAGTLSQHGAGHYAMGGDGSDVFTSLNDPAFYLHHAMVDKLYWMWQALHPKEANTVAGTLTYMNIVPSRNGTVEDELDVGILGPHLKIKDTFNTLGGTPYCYIYE
ncbi:uncharacterized protein F5Z01DRAFT_741998 [Emericellopsis atlantica]|uniref:Tyrosinase copper-binding domain-containing protein n=1 Tax=Emericellopsis atlantica TaxID=2614577 RepID=A0A9P7ZR50_9HYPO|nr:uncharacterized protein F5Z01DRAFT_741998 [Emericellopsis atlantica]KAG9256690.1 hypothetical protein F5Z01DRAFT_741998 [Emericellopsis atlantica]